MKILIVGNGSTGIDSESKEHYITKNTGEFLKSVGNEFDIYFLQFQSVYNKDSNIVDFGLKVNSINSKIFSNKKNPVSYIRLIKLIVEMDQIYLFYPGSLGKLVGLFAGLLNKPMGLYIRGQFYNQDKIDRFILKKTNFILTISPLFAQDLLKFSSKVDVIKPMINIQQSDLKKDRIYNTPKKWNLLFVGRVEERKGIQELLQIAKNLKANNFDFSLNIVGGGDLFTETNTKIKELHLEDNVVLHGLVSDKDQLRALYNKANAFVFTSHDEGFPRVLYEAMASGLPIFTTFVGGISGRMEHLKNCIEIPVKNADAAGTIVSKYLKEEKVLEEIGKNGQKTIELIIGGSLLPHEDLFLKYINLR